MTEGAWELLSRMDAPAPEKKKKTAAAASSKKRKNPEEVRALTEAFIDLLLGFFASNGSFLAILRHEAQGGGAAATKIVADHVGPVFEAIVSRIDALRARGEVRKDVVAKHLVLSCVAMVAFPFQEEPFVTAIWKTDWHDRKFLAERKQHIVDMVLARVLP